MANVTVGSGFNMSNINVYDDDDGGQRVSVSATEFIFENPVLGTRAVISGSGFVFNPIEGWIGGTASKIEFTQNGNILIVADGVSVDGAFDGYDQGYAGYFGLTADVAYWLRGADVFRGTTGGEIVNGFGGNDVFIADAGNDTIDGGQDSDTVQYAGSRNDFTVSQEGVKYIVTSSQFGTDTLVNVETLQFNDQTLAIFDALKNNSEPGDGGTGNLSTAEFLIQKFNITIQDAGAWVFNNLDKPEDIYTICSNNGVTSNMLADVVQPFFPGVVVTGVLVNEWMVANGQPTLI